MIIPTTSRFLSWLRVVSVGSASLVATTLLVAADAVELRPLKGAVYSGSATVSPYAAKVFVSGVSAPEPAAVLAGLEKSLALAGLDRAAIVNVRAGLLPAGEKGEIDMDGWNAGWKPFFEKAANPPTRTTVGAVALADPAAKLGAEAVAAFFPKPDAPLPGRAGLNPYVRLVGEGAYGSSAATIVLPGTAILFSAGVLADPADATKPERTVERFGPMAAQTKSILKKLERTLMSQGLQWEDVFYVRALLSPAPGETAVDFAAFGEVFAASFAGRHPDLKPALTVLAAPGFNFNGQLIEIEIYAAASDGKGPFGNYDSAAANPWLAMTGTPEAQISSSGAAARYRPLTWYSGVVPPAGTTGDMHDHGVSALLSLRARLKEAGADFGDAVQLRAYPVVGDSFVKNMALWNEAYGRFYNIAKINPHKPARTSFPVGALPRGTAIEIELITVGK